MIKVLITAKQPGLSDKENRDSILNKQLELKIMDALVGKMMTPSYDTTVTITYRRGQDD